MASSSHTDTMSSSVQRFNNYLNSVREEFELQSNPISTKSLSQRRFNIYLGGLSSEFELMSLEIESLQNERDEYREKVKMQAKELLDLRRNLVCESCSKGSMGDKSDTGESDDNSSQPTIEKLHSCVTTPRSSQIASRSFATIATHPTTETVSLPPAPSQPSQPRDWSITFNNEVDRELDVKLAHTLCHERQICCVTFSPDGKYLAVGCVDGKAYIYHVESATLTCVFRNLLAEYQYITAVCFIRDGKYLATGSTDGEVYIWKIETKHVQKGFKGHTSSILSLDISPDGRWLVSTSRDNTVRVWNTRSGAGKVFNDDDPEFTDDPPKIYNPPNYTSAVFSPDGRYVAASHMDALVRIWDVRAGQLMRRVDAHMNWVYDVGFMPDGNGLMTCSRDKTLRYWDVSSLGTTRSRPREATEVEEQTQPEREFLGHESSVHCIAISPDGRWVASGSPDDSCRIWDTRNAQMQCILDHKQWVGTVDFSPAGGYLASGANDGAVRIWRYFAGKQNVPIPHPLHDREARRE